MHDPMSAEGHFDQPTDIFFAPVADQPGGIFVRADAAGVLQLRDHIFSESAFQIGIRKVCQDLFGGLLHFLRIPVQFPDIQLPGELCDRVSGKLVPCSNDWSMDGLGKAAGKQNLRILRDHFMCHNVFDPENMPDRITQCLTVIAVRSGKGHLIKGLFGIRHHDLGDLFKQRIP